MAYSEDTAARRWRLRPKGSRRRPSRAQLAGEYGTEHRRLRAEWAPHVAAGMVDCHRPHCQAPQRRIHPGEPWDLGHTDDRTGWTGPEHRRCNRAAGARTANAQRRAARAQAVSRDW